MPRVTPSPTSTYTVKNLNSSESEVDSTAANDLLDAYNEAVMKCGGIATGEFRTINLHTTSSESRQNRPCGEFVKLKNVSGSIRPITNNLQQKRPVYEKVKKFNALSWQALKNGDRYNDLIARAAGTNSLTASTSSSFLDTMPVGRKLLIVNKTSNAATGGWSGLFDNDLDKVSGHRTPFVDNQGSTTASEVDTYFTTYKTNGNEINHILGDFEDISDIVSINVIDDSSARIDAWDGDSRFDDIKTENGDADFQYLKTGSSFTTQKMALQAILRRVAYGNIYKFILKPIKDIFPNVTISNYDDWVQPNDLTPNVYPEVDSGGQFFPRHIFMGDYQSPVQYGQVGSVSESPPTELDPYPKSPFNACLAGVNQMRSAYRALPFIPIVPWITNPSRTDLNIQWNSDNRYFSEHIRHCALYGVGTFLYFNGLTSVEADDVQLYDTLAELNTMIGQNTMVPVTVDEHDWHPTFIISGGKIQSQDKTLWRVTTGPSVTDITIDGVEYDVTDKAGAWHEATLGTTSLTVVDIS